MSSATATSPREVGRSATQVLDDMAGAVASARTYHLVADLTGPVHVDLRIGGTSLVTGTLAMRGATADILIDQGSVYVRGREFFRLTSGDSAANTVGDRWVLLPAASSSVLTSSLTRFADTATLARCIVGGPHGTLTVRTAAVEGRDVVEIDDAGDRPGATRSSLLVDATTALPVEERLLGSPAPGGPAPDPACGPGAGGPAVGVVSFDGWGSPLSATPPPSPLDLAGG